MWHHDVTFPLSDCDSASMADNPLSVAAEVCYMFNGPVYEQHRQKPQN